MLAAKGWRTSPLTAYESVSVQAMLFRGVWRMEDLKTIFDTTATHSEEHVSPKSHFNCEESERGQKMENMIIKTLIITVLATNNMINNTIVFAGM